MIWKFESASLPCNEKEDFNTRDIATDIVCRIYLSEAPSKKLEKEARKIDGKFYNKTCFCIEAVCGKNEPDGDILTSGWYLYYVDNDGNMTELGCVDGEIDGAWEFFKEKTEVEF